MRIDKWLWAARFYKTRSLATHAVGSGQVRLNAERCKPARELRVGDEVLVRSNGLEWQVIVKGLSDRRGSASVAQGLYEESEASRARREDVLLMRRLSSEPAREINGRPTKRDRRILTRFKEGE
jgi:ribosome-associated heat shock protein Hsp15